jgi:hypothetical protein
MLMRCSAECERFAPYACERPADVNMHCSLSALQVTERMLLSCSHDGIVKVWK